MISLPCVVERERQVCRSIEFLKNATLPSAFNALTPPLWKLRAATNAGDFSWQGGLRLYG